MGGLVTRTENVLMQARRFKSARSQVVTWSLVDLCNEPHEQHW